MRRFLFFIGLLFVVFTTECHSQNILKGRVTDGQGTPLSDVVLSWMTVKDSLLVANAITAADGAFSLISRQTVTDSTCVVATSVGYTPVTVFLAPNHEDTLSVVMSEATHQLQGVTVTAKSTMHGIPGGFAFTPKGNDLLLPNGYMLLSNVPLVNIQNGQLRLVGKGRAILYINGHNPHMSDQMVLNLLRNARAGDVERIDLIYDPGSSQSASARMPIVNIVMKRPDFGVQGLASIGSTLSGGRLKSSANSTLYYSHGQFRVTGELQIGISNTYSRQESSYEYLTMDKTIREVMTTSEHTPWGYGDVVASYDFGKGGTVGLSLSAATSAEKHNMHTETSTIIPSSGDTQTTSSDRVRKAPLSDRGSYSVTAFYLCNTDSLGSSVDVSALFGQLGEAWNDTLRVGQAVDVPVQDGSFAQNTSLHRTRYVISAKRQRCVGKDKVKFTYGLCLEGLHVGDSYYKADYVSGAYVDDVSRNNRFVYDETVGSVYVNYDHVWSKCIQSSFGVRGEYTHARGDQRVTGETFDRDYFQLFPNASLTFNFSGGNHIVKFSYDRSIRRPSYTMLNPFKVWATPTTCTTGNPKLNPELTHFVSMTYVLFRDYSLWLSYSRTSDYVGVFTLPTDEGISVTRNENYGRSSKVYMEISAYQRLFRGRCRLRGSVIGQYLNERGYIGERLIGNHSWSMTYVASATAFFTPAYDLYATVQYLGSTRSRRAMMTTAATNGVSFYLTKEFGWGGTLSLSGTVSFPAHAKSCFLQDDYRYRLHLQTSEAALSLSYSQSFGKKRVRGAKSYRQKGLTSRM